MGTQFVLITGLSGSGKSSVVNTFEDMGYYTVDNLPLTFLRQLLAEPSKLVPKGTRIAAVTDVRTPGFAAETPQLLNDLDTLGHDVSLLYLEADDEALLRRFSETRRPHPLAGDCTVIDAIGRERSLLAELRGRADLVFDTSQWSIHEVRQEVLRKFATEPGEEPSLVVSVESFGFKHGIPYGTDLMYDVRFLSNPHFVPSLRPLTGESNEVQQFLDEDDDFAELVERITDYLLWVVPRHRRENRSYLSVGIGCTGGRHRSVAVSELVTARLEAAGCPVRLMHRDSART